MKAIVKNIYDNPKYGRVFEWGKLVALTGSAQLLVQLTSLVSGILIIRLLSTTEYALYTLANTMLGTMTILADGGICMGVMAEGGKVWQDKEKLGVVLATGLNLRRKFGIICLAVSTPIFFFLLYKNGASVFFAALILLSIIPSFFAAVSDSLLEVGLKLNQDIGRLQKNQVFTSIGRIILITASIFVFPWTFVAILGNGIPRIWANIRLKKISDEYADPTMKPDPVIRQKIMDVVKRILPGTIYYCLYSQITIWLCSILGSSSTAIAQAGALSRLIMALSLFNMLFTTLISPRFARLPNQASVLLKRFIQIEAGLFVLIVFIIGFVWLFPKEVLWILGKNYSNLTNEIVLNVVGSCLMFVAASTVSLFTHRGWVMNPVISIGVSLLSIASGAMMINISTLSGIFVFNIYLAAIQVIMYFIYMFLKIQKSKTQVVSS